MSFLKGMTVLTVGTVFSLSATAQTGSQLASVKPLSEQAFSQLLQQTQEASLKREYEGVYVSQWGNQDASSSHILNFQVQDKYYRKVEALDGDPFVQWRTNQVQLQIIPSQKRVIYTYVRDYDFPGLLILGNHSLSTIVHYYKAQIHPTPTRVAGLPCNQVDILPLDKDRYGFKLCVEPKTHLLLMVESLGDDQRVIGHTTFTSLVARQGSADLLKQVKPDMDKSYQWYKYERKTVPITNEGWQFDFPKGFEVVLSSLMPFGHDQLIHQITLSDGLSTLSVFIQAVPADASVVEGESVQGNLNIYSRHQGDFLMTAVGVLPLKALQSVVHSAKQITQ